MEPLGLLHSGGRVSYATARTDRCSQTRWWPSVTTHKHWRLAEAAVGKHMQHILSSHQSASQDLGGQEQIYGQRQTHDRTRCFGTVNVLCL